MTEETLRVLLVEDSRGDAMVTRALVAEAGRRAGIHFELEHVLRFADALERLEAPADAIDIVMLDLGLPDAEGADAVADITREHPGVAVVVMTANDDRATAVHSVVSGAQEFLRKGQASPDDLGRILRIAALRARLEQTVRQSEAEHRALFKNNPHPIWVIARATLDMLAANDAAVALLGWSPAELLGLRFPQLHPDEPEAELHAALHAPPEPQRVWRQRTRDGRTLRVQVSAHDVLFRQRAAVIVIAQDVTESQQRLELLQASEQRFRELFELSPGLLCEHDLDGYLLSINPAAARLLGYEPEALLGTRLHAILPAAFVGTVEAYLADIRRTGEFHGVMTVQTRDKHWRALRFNNRLYVESGRAFVVGHAQDVTDTLREEDRLRTASLTDPLTGARNRRFLDEFAQRGPQDWGCIVLDLDGFKAINDREGHRRGDEVLVEVVRFLQANALRDDVVVRLGGDEFMLLLQEGAAADTADTAHALEAAAAQGAPRAMSIGWAVRQHDERLTDTIARADAMLYRDRAQRRTTAAQR